MIWFLAVLILFDLTLQIKIKYQWRQYIVENKLIFDQTEKNSRYRMFEENMKFIESFNKKSKDFKLGVTKFAHMTHKEFKESILRSKLEFQVANNTYEIKNDSVALGETIDWRLKGAVTPVKEQGYCTAPWAFSVVGALEGAYAIKTSRLISLSEQQLIDCVSNNYGCHGGLISNTYSYLARTPIESTYYYPYAQRQQFCKYNSHFTVVKISKSSLLREGDESQLQLGIKYFGPISVMIDASDITFQHYRSGVYSSISCSSLITKLNHAMVVVGYGSTYNGIEYYIVKNSWGINWGVDGYVYMARNRLNNCGIASYATFPTI